MKKWIIAVNLLVWLTSPYVFSAEIDLPKYSLEDMEYLGAFRLPDDQFGDARVAWSGGKIAVDENDQTFFFSGSNKRSIAQFKLPNNISKSNSVGDLPIIEPPIQNFSNVLNRAPTGNPNNVDTITGLSLIGERLFVNAAVYYDANTQNDHTTLIIEDPSNLSGSDVRGYMTVEGENHAAGWIYKLPSFYASIFGKDLLTGHASNLPINARNSMGPSAFLGSSADFLSATPGNVIPTVKLLDFSINNLLHKDVNNDSLSNDLWTELSYAFYGFIIPGTSTYLTIGQSGGHDSGIGYKITQPNGYNCGGFCAYDHKDYYNYIWLWDTNDLLTSLQGKLRPSDIRPYKYGKLNLPHEDPRNEDYAFSRVIGADFTSSGKLYIVLSEADTLQSEYEKQPIILIYQLFPNKPNPPSNIEIN